MTQYSDLVKRDNIKVMRGDSLSLTDVQGLYNQPLFDLDADDSLMAFSLINSYSPALDVIGFINNNSYRLERNMITYVAPNGTAAGSPTSSDHTDACAPGNSFEFGTVNYTLEGWGRMRRSSPSRDITDVVTHYYQKDPRYDIAGQMIMDDAEWDLVQMGSVMLQDLQRRVIDGDASSAGQADGLSQLVAYGYTDPITGNAVSAMDSFVFDYNDNVMCPTADTTGVTFNGNLLDQTGLNIYRLIESALRRVRQRVRYSSLAGKNSITHIGLISLEHLNSLIECYVCHTHCGGDQGQMMEMEVQQKLESLKSSLSGSGAVQLSFYGIPVTFFVYDYGLLDEASDGIGDIYILTTRVGSTPLLNIQMKDLGLAANHEAMNAASMGVSDGNRWLRWETYDHTCFQRHTEAQWRIDMPAPWAQIVIRNVDAAPLLGSYTGDPLSVYFNSTTTGTVASTASDFAQYSAPVAADLNYAVLLNTTLNVAAANGVVDNSTGYPTPTATAVAAVATTQGGTITINADGSFSYDPPTATFTGQDTYVYTITNSEGNDTGTITITVFDNAA